MKQYSTILLQVCVVNIVSALVYGIVQYEFEVVHGWIFVRSGAPWFPNVGIWPAITSWFHIVAIMTQLWLIPLQSVFRYFVIVEKRSLKSKTTVIGILCVTLYSMFIATINLIPIFDPSSIKKNYLIVQYLDAYNDDPTVLASFRSVYLLDPFILGFCGVYSITTTVSVFLMIILTIKTHRHLKKVQSQMTSKTILMHRQFGFRILIQALIPASIFSFYTFIMFLMFLGSAEKIGGKIFAFAVLPFTCISFLDPLITIVTIKGYRKALLGGFCGKYHSNDPSQIQNPLKKFTVTSVSGKIF
ncbi:hypothetical protein FO519_004793 [Halicephalobus sp. NKZ332]|nr:hypothetical protein FO519_004793 [Halicephalobus sp. NKZ332]